MDINNDLEAGNKAAAEELTEEFYNGLMIRFGLYSSEILRAVDLVGQYIRREKKILVGGMAIDLALQKKGSFLYGDNVIADHDFFSPHHAIDAYEIGQWLIRTKYPGVTVIHAVHPSTMRVRVNFEPVADCTYIPPIIYDKLPTILSRGYVVIHPNFQMINQHIVFSKPYDGKPFETILSSRWKKDMERYDLLYEYYPLVIPKEQFTEHKMREIKLIDVTGQCVTGMAALIYWLEKAKKLGFSQEKEYGHFDTKEMKVRMRGPVAILSNDFEKLYPKSGARCFNRLVDHLPRYFEWNDYQVFDNRNAFISASEYDGVYFANLQHIMLYLLTNLIMRKVSIQDYFYGYLTCREIIKWASREIFTKGKTDETLYKFLPVVTYYGSDNISESYHLALEMRENKKSKLKPRELFQHTLINMTVPEEFKKFNYEESWVFDFDGQETKPFFKNE